MEGGRIKAKAFKAKAFKAKAFKTKAFKTKALAIEVWPAKRMTIDMAICSRKTRAAKRRLRTTSFSGVDDGPAHARGGYGQVGPLLCLGEP
jgi:hypothetical protein